MEESISIFENIRIALTQMTWVEIAAVITGIIYVILAARENIWCWSFGIISSLLSIHFFYSGKLYAESMLYFYYVVAGIYGWYAWRLRSNKPRSTEVLDTSEGNREMLRIHLWKRKTHLLAIGAGVVLSLVLAFLLKEFTDANIPMLDSFTTVFSFIATYMVTRKVLENWIYWIVIDLVTTGMYYHRGYYLYALLMIIYTIVAVIGLRNWNNQRNKKQLLSKAK